MPFFAATILRQLVQMTVVLGIQWAAERFILPYLNDAIVETMVALGVDEETAKDIMANELLIFAEQVSIGAVTLKARLPMKIADKLGFTTKGFAKRAIRATTKGQAGGTSILATASATATAAEVSAMSKAIAKVRGISFQQVNAVTSFLIKIVALPVGFFYAAAQYFDYAAWQNPYQPTMMRLLETIGIKPDAPLPSARNISTDSWKRIYSVVESLNPQGIAMPFSGVDLPYSRENLAKAVDEIAANILKAKGQATFKNVWGLLLPLLQGVTEPTGALAETNTAVSSGITTTQPTIRVVTGIVSQGKLAAATDFIPRQDDLISSSGELKTAAANNLAPFLASLPGRVSYEIRIKPSVRTKDGFEQRGTVQTVQVGTFADGTPKTKRVVNKFAVMSLFLATDKGSRSKITEIILGPTDAVAFQPSENDLAELATDIQANMTSSGSFVQTQQPQITKVDNAPTNEATAAASSAQPRSAGKPPKYPDTLRVSVQPGTYVDWQGWFGRIYRRIGNSIFTIEPSRDVLSEEENKLARNEGERWALAVPRLRRMGVDVETLPKVKFSSEIDGRYAIVGSLPFEQFFGLEAIENRTPTKGCDATTLNEWYVSQGGTLPPVDERSTLYESLGLGQAVYYTGTAEQNIKLLGALKSRAGCLVA